MEQIEVNGLCVDVIRKDIKNLHLGVYPPDGRVRVAAPSAVSDEAMRQAVITRQGGDPSATGTLCPTGAPIATRDD